MGKPVGSDLREGKRTMVLIHALSLANDLQRKQIFSVLGNGEARSDQVEAVVSLIKSLGSVDYAVRKADEFIKNAKLQLSRFPHSSERDVLESLCDYIVSRKY